MRNLRHIIFVWRRRYGYIFISICISVPLSYKILFRKFFVKFLLFLVGLHNLRNENVQGFFSMHKYCVPMNFFKNGSDEFFVGRAGFLAACYTINKRFGRTIVSSDITLPLCNTIIESGRRLSQRYDHDCPLMYTYYDTQYLGTGSFIYYVRKVFRITNISYHLIRTRTRRISVSKKF